MRKSGPDADGQAGQGDPENKTGRLIVLGVAILVIAGLIIATWHQRTPPPQLTNPAKLIQAGRAFTRRLLASKLTVPETVSLKELVSGGYLTADDVRAFEGMDVMISLKTTAADPSKQELARARFPDGSEMVLMLDGSVRGPAK